MKCGVKIFTWFLLNLSGMYQVSCEEEIVRQTNTRVAMGQMRELKDSPSIADIPWEDEMNPKEDAKEVAKEDAKKAQLLIGKIEIANKGELIYY